MVDGKKIAFKKQNEMIREKLFLFYLQLKKKVDQKQNNENLLP